MNLDSDLSSNISLKLDLFSDPDSESDIGLDSNSEGKYL